MTLGIRNIVIYSYCGHNNAIENELDRAKLQGATDLRKNKVQVDAMENRVYTASGSYRKPDASYVLKGTRININYVSNPNNASEVLREIEAFQDICEADPDAINMLLFDY